MDDESSNASKFRKRRLSPINWPRLCRHLRLTPRQSQILQLIVEQELTYEAIGKQLGIAELTVCTHVVRIRSRLGVDSRSALVSKTISTWHDIASLEADYSTSE